MFMIVWFTWDHDGFCNMLYLQILNFLQETAYYFEWDYGIYHEDKL